MSKNKENKDKALDSLKDIAKNAASKKVKKTKLGKAANKVAKENPITLSALGIGAKVLTGKAAKIRKKLGKGFSVEGSYDSRTKEKKAGIFFNKEF